jgi:hypothetical protein
MESAEYIDQMMLFSGDGDFRSLLAAVQRRSVRVTVIHGTQPPMITDELRRHADVFIDLRELQPRLAANRHPRAGLSSTAVPMIGVPGATPKHNAAQAEYVRLAALGWSAGPSNPQYCFVSDGGRSVQYIAQIVDLAE